MARRDLRRSLDRTRPDQAPLAGRAPAPAARPSSTCRPVSLYSDLRLRARGGASLSDRWAGPRTAHAGAVRWSEPSSAIGSRVRTASRRVAHRYGPPIATGEHPGVLVPSPFVVTWYSLACAPEANAADAPSVAAATSARRLTVLPRRCSHTARRACALLNARTDIQLPCIPRCDDVARVFATTPKCNRSGRRRE